MGVKDLWKVLQPASSTESLTRLAIDELEASFNSHCGYRIGIDASIWFGHTEMLTNKAKLGENPELRILFFHCARLLKLPVRPLFVFDGPKRPKIKRGKMAQFKGSRLVAGMKRIIDAFGFQYHFAPGEAEAELAYFNNIGVIDAVWTDDVDVFLFGATTVLRNPSSQLSGNINNPVLNAEGRDDGNHVRVYTASRIRENSEVRLTRNGLILIALLRGGDYNKGGVPDIGIVLARRLAHCGFGETLVQAVESMQDDDLSAFLHGWRDGVVDELRTDSRNILGKKYKKLAQSFPQGFPNVENVRQYLDPATSGSSGRVPEFNWHHTPDITRLADICELYFDWGYEKALLHRFQSLIWPGVVTQMLRRVIICAQAPSMTDNVQQTAPTAPSTSTLNTGSSESLDTSIIIKIHSQREHASTDGTPELRLEVNPAALVELAKAGLAGTRNGSADTVGSIAQELEDPLAPFRVWMPTSLVQRAVPRFVDEYTERADKQPKKRKRDPGMLTANRRGSSGATGTGIAGAASNKSARASAEQSSPRVQAGSGSKRAHPASTMVDTDKTSDKDVIVISDSDGGKDDTGATKVTLQLA